MSGAQSWSVKGIDPKVREAVREAAARQGMSLGEYLSQALQNHQPGASAPGAASAQAHSYTGARTRAGRFGAASRYEEEGGDDDWNVSSSSPTRTTDPVRLAQRIETIERRTQLAVTGLDRAVSTIDRSVLGLAARVEDAEAASHESADRIAEAIEHFRVAGETLSGRLQEAEQDAAESRRALDSARVQVYSTQEDFANAKERLESQVALADEVARRAEAAASFLTTELESRDAATREALSRNLSEARAIAEDAARQAASASADAVIELRQLQESLSERLAETESSTRRAVEVAIEEVRSDIGERASRGARDTLLQEVGRLEAQIASRLAIAEELKTEQAGLIGRIERAEAGARESTAGLRQAAGAAIADLRNAQLTLAARLKTIEETGGASTPVDLTDVRQQQQDIAERLAALETKTEHSPVTDALAAFEQRIAEIENNGGAP